jgi:hypothetical protein
MFNADNFDRDRLRIEYNILDTLEFEPRSLTPTGVDHSSLPDMKDEDDEPGGGA